MSELVFVRHGQASFGADSYDKLSDIGLKQVEILADHWKSTGEQFDCLYSGNLQRQLETAAVLSPLIGERREQVGNGRSAAPVVHHGFDEYNGSPLIEMYLRDHADTTVELPILDRKLFQTVFEAATARWIAGDLIPTPADLEFEAWADFQRRVHGAVDELMERHRNGSRVLISTSGGVIAMAMQRVLGLSDSHVIATNWMVNNSSITRIRYGGGRQSLSLFNGLPHLENAEYRQLITFR